MEDSGASSEPEIEEIIFDASHDKVSGNADNPKPSPIVREARPRKRALEASPNDLNLDRHVIQRTSSLPEPMASWYHKCKFCGIAFSTGTALGGHSRVHRHQLPAKASSKPPFLPPCPICPHVRFRDVLRLRAHLADHCSSKSHLSPGEERTWVRCVLCGTELPNRRSLFHHFNLAHTYLQLEGTHQNEQTEFSKEAEQKKTADKSVKEIEVIDLESDEEEEEMVFVKTGRKKGC